MENTKNLQDVNIKNVNREYLWIRIMTFVRYFGDCLFYGYLYLFLRSRGLDESQIGMVCAITPIVTLLCNPFWNLLSKNVNTNRTIMRIITVLEGIFILVFTSCTMVEWLAIMLALIAFVGSPFYNLHDGFSGTFAKAYQKDYGSIRSIGSLAYFSATLFAGLILYLTKDNYSVLLYVGGAIFIAVNFFFFLIKPIDLKLVDEGKEVKRNYKAVLKNKTFWFYMLIYFLIITVSYSSDAFVSLYFTEYQQVDSYIWSLIFAGYLTAEFVTMFILSHMKKPVNPNVLWVILGFTYTLRSFAFFLDLPLPFEIAFALLRGVSFGLVLTANVKCLEQICGIENMTSGFFVLAIGTALVQAISNFTFGNLISAIGYPMFFGIISLICGTGAILNLIYQLCHHFTYPSAKTLEKKEEL